MTKTSYKAPIRKYSGHLLINTKIKLSSSPQTSVTAIHGPKLSGIYSNVILVYSRPIHTCKYKQLNYTKWLSNDDNAVHILGHGTKTCFFQERAQQC